MVIEKGRVKTQPLLAKLLLLVLLLAAAKIAASIIASKTKATKGVFSAMKGNLVAGHLFIQFRFSVTYISSKTVAALRLVTPHSLF